MPAIDIDTICKSYGGVPAIENISFSVDKGELFGLIGPDGAGKTTLFKILVTLLLPSAGKARVQGYDVVDDFLSIRQIIGYMPGKFSLYQDLSIEENLEFFATVFKTTVKENYDMIRDIYVQIEPFKKRRAGQLSGGMKQKLALCCALIHKPQVLFLDEPTTGVDAVSRKEFWDMLQTLKAQGITILVSTAYMDEAALCDRIALIQHGKILSVNTNEGIIAGYKKPLYAVKSGDTYRLLNDLRSLAATESCYPFGEYVHWTAKNEETGKPGLETYLAQCSHRDVEVKRISPGIEDCFMDLMRKP
ncbi:MAG TPA: ABC transporter ATP-binding protein [Bacteroidia bacterium]|nr:ABC transporter ATP-binding protein [Bacteroidia bacterium]